jgi:rod shape-determining protein MreC
VPYGDNKHFEHLKLPVTWVVIGIVVVVIVMAGLMLLGDKRDEVDQGAYAARTGFDAAAGPVNNVLSWPVHKVGDGTNWLDDYLFAVRENRILKKKVAELTMYRDAYLEQKDINSRYEALLNLRTEPPVDTVTARSVSVSRGPFNNNRLIDAGSEKRIAFGNPVITDQGLVGRVVGVSPYVSRVLMVTDATSHVPIMVMRTDARAMMTGDGGGYPKLEFVRGKDAVKKGDQILTSGDGGIFPRGVPVGIAVKGVDNVWRVKLYADRAPIDFVKVLLFKDFSRLPNADQLLKTPPVSDLLPPPPMPKVDANSAASAAAAANASAAAASAPPAARPVTVTPASAVTTPKTPIRPETTKPEAAKPAIVKPVVKPKPEMTPATSPAATEPVFKPFVPSSSAGGTP